MIDSNSSCDPLEIQMTIINIKTSKVSLMQPNELCVVAVTRG